MSSTVRDVAERAQVSAATVSLVLNGKGGISEETRTRVLMAAAELNYAARSPKVAQVDEKINRFTPSSRIALSRYRVPATFAV